jgi:dienelactone hydrolase
MPRLWRADSFWFDDGERATTATWFSPTDPNRRTRRVGVLVLHGIGHEEEAVSVGAPEISGSVAARGLLSLGIDFVGNGESLGDLAQPDITQAWCHQIVAAIAYLRRNGAEQVAVVAPRIAAVLALRAAEKEPVDAMVLWSPVLAGKRYVRELRMMQGMAAVALSPTDGQIAVGGFTLPGVLVDALARLDAAEIKSAPPAILYLETPERAVDDPAVARLRSLGADVEVRASAETTRWLFLPTDNASVPFATAREVAAWIDGKLSNDGWTAPIDPHSLPTKTSFSFDGREVTESFVRVGNLGLSGVLVEPSSPDPARSAVLFLSMGPGRSFVRAARRAASEGRRALRFDFSGFGLSPLRPEQEEPELYGLTGPHDVRLGVAYLLERGAPSIVIVGFCAGAWSSIVSEPLRGVIGIAAINVHLSVRLRKLAQRSKNNQTWQPDLAAPTKRTLLDRVRDRVDRLKLSAGPAIAWLNAQGQAGVSLSFFFDPHDLGFQYWDGVLSGFFRREVARRTIEVRTYSGLGHLAEGVVARNHVFEDIHRFIDFRDPKGQTR